jgi:dienelactone hydrolase
VKQFVRTIVVLLIAASVCVAADVKKEDADVKSPDGVNLRVTYWSAGHPAPSIILLHQCDKDRHAWAVLATDLAAQGFNVLTFDFRSHGDSGGEKVTDPEARRIAQQTKWPGDSDAAFSYLLSQKDVDKSRIAAGGASCGVGQAAALAARHHEIRALVVLSGAATEEAKDYIAATPSLPVFGAVSENDKVPNVVADTKDVAEKSKNPRSVFKIYPGAEHGALMFAPNPDLEAMLIAWLKAELGMKKVPFISLNSAVDFL